ncbi:MAG: PBECR2 nuclease fold domain-containing protein [Verrucomicrobiota bacterium]
MVKFLKDYAGCEVRLTEERLEHILEHPEMSDMENALEQTLRDPQKVIQSKSDESAALNYRYYFGTKVGDKWLCVVVKYSDGDAFVLTAYLTDKPKKGEQLWPLQ